MYIRGGQTYYTGTQQRATRGDFLLLFNDQPGGEIRYAIRRVAMAQCGHFMMGFARIGGKVLSVSGTYGNDGLPIHASTLPEGWWGRLPSLPSDMADAYWHSTGSGSVLRAFARTRLAS